LGYAQTDCQLAWLLVVLWKAKERCGLKNDAYLPLLVLMEGNKHRSFEDLESTLKEILSSFYLTLYFWTTAYVHPLSFTLANFLARFSLFN
jgi:hypothetical protein